MLTGCQKLDSLLTMSYKHVFIKKAKLNMSFSGLIDQKCMHQKLKYVYIVQTFVFVKKSYFGGHLGCHF